MAEKNLFLLDQLNSLLEANRESVVVDSLFVKPDNFDYFRNLLDAMGLERVELLVNEVTGELDYDFLLRIIANSNREAFIENLKLFFLKLRKRRVYDLLIEMGALDIIIEVYYEFKDWISKQELLNLLLSYGDWGERIFIENLKFFRDEIVKDKSVIRFLANEGKILFLLSILENPLESLSAQEWIDLIFQKGQIEILSEKIGIFINQVDKAKLVNDLLQANQASLILYYYQDLSEFVEPQKLIDALFEQGDQGIPYLSRYLYRFIEKLDGKALVARLLELGRADIVFVYRGSLLEFTSIKEIVDNLIQAERADFIANNYDDFSEFISPEQLLVELLKIGITGRYAFSRNKDRFFAHIDGKKKLFDKLLENGQFGLIAESFEEFGEYISAQELVENLIKQGASAFKALFDNFSKLGIDKKTVLELLLDQGRAIIVAQRFEFFREIITPDELARELFKLAEKGIVVLLRMKDCLAKLDQAVFVQNLLNFGFSWYIARNYSLYREYISVNELISYLIKDHEYDQITGLVVQFAEEIDGNLLVESLLADEQFTNVIENLNLVEPEKRRKYLVSLVSTIGRKYSYNNILLTNLNIFTESELDLVQPLLDSLSKDKVLELIRSYVFNKNYQALYILLLSRKVVLADKELEFDFFLKQIKNLIRKKQLTAAKTLIKCAKLLFPEKLEQLNNLVTPFHDLTKSNNHYETRPIYQRRYIVKEVFKYYLAILFKNKFEPHRLDSGLMVEFDQIIKDFFDLIREYLIIAVKSELKEAIDQGEISTLPIPKSDLYFCSLEEIRLFFMMAQTKFRDYRAFPNQGFGKKAWETVAVYGEKVWQDKKDLDLKTIIGLLNIVISLEHNAGSIFNKDSGRIILDEALLMDLLDFEASGNRDPESFLYFGLEHELLSEDEYSRYLNLVTEFSKKDNLKHVRQLQFFGHKLVLDKLSKEVQEALKTIREDENLPLEVREFVSFVYSRDGFFMREENCFIWLGRLLKTLGEINWTSENEVIKKYSKGEDEFIFINIAGFVFAFWYQRGKIKYFENKEDLIRSSQELAKLFERPIIRANFSYLREGD